MNLSEIATSEGFERISSIIEHINSGREAGSDIGTIFHKVKEALESTKDDNQPPVLNTPGIKPPSYIRTHKKIPYPWALPGMTYPSSVRDQLKSVNPNDPDTIDVQPYGPPGSSPKMAKT